MSGYLIHSRNHKGSILLETLLSIMILSVSVTLIIQSLMSSLRASAYSAHYTVAAALLESRMTELLISDPPEDVFAKEEEISFPHDQFRYELTVNDLDADEFESIKDVRISVLWKSGKKNNRLTLNSYIPGESEE